MHSLAAKEIKQPKGGEGRSPFAVASPSRKGGRSRGAPRPQAGASGASPTPEVPCLGDAARRKPSEQGSARKPLLRQRSATIANCGWGEGMGRHGNALPNGSAAAAGTILSHGSRHDSSFAKGAFWVCALGRRPNTKTARVHHSQTPPFERGWQRVSADGGLLITASAP